MKATLSHIISWVFLPLLMPNYGLILTLYLPSQSKSIAEVSLYALPEELKSQLLFVFFVFSALLPAMAFFTLHKQGVISTIDMENRLERSVPLIIMFVFCLLLFILFQVKAPDHVLPKYLYALPLAGALVTGIFMFINRFIKISLHAGGAGILVGFLMAYIAAQVGFAFWVLPLAILASGVTIAARLYLGKHQPIEVYTGWTLAVTITFCCNYFYPVG